MAKRESVQKKLQRIRPSRVQLTYDVEIGDAKDEKVFKAVFLTENFKMIHGTYNINDIFF